MKPREESIAQAALRMYATKGVRRTTMMDIASEAGITRQTVYNSFPNTDAVLRGAVLYYIDGLWHSISDQWQDCETLDEKLDVLLHHFAVEPWEFLNNSVEAAELERGYNNAGKSAIEEARQGFRKEIAALFEPWEDSLVRQGTHSLAISDYISAAIEGIKYNSKTRDELLLAIATLKAGLMALTR